MKKKVFFFARSAHSQRAHTTLELLCLFIFSQTIRLTREEPTNNVTRSDRTNLLLFTLAAHRTTHYCLGDFFRVVLFVPLFLLYV